MATSSARTGHGWTCAPSTVSRRRFLLGHGKAHGNRERSVENSLCFGMYDPTGRQAGFARVITDFATFGWICDVFVLDGHRGKGLGKWLMQTIVAFPGSAGPETHAACHP